MADQRIALSTNDLKNLSNDSFGHSHYFRVVDLVDDGFEEVDLRENVLFMQACDLRGRVEHLHGLLIDVEYLVGSQFKDSAREQLEELGHRVITRAPKKLQQIIEQLRTADNVPE